MSFSVHSNLKLRSQLHKLEKSDRSNPSELEVSIEELIRWDLQKMISVYELGMKQPRATHSALIIARL
jgi:hypothetical protein